MSTPTLEQNFEQTLRELNSVIGQNANLREENAKLREALRKMGTVNAHLEGAAFRMQEIARQSLGES